MRTQELRSTVLQLILNLTQLDSQPMKTFITRLSLMQMDSQMIPNLWTSLEHGQGANYRLVATDKVDYLFKICVEPNHRGRHRT